MPGGSPTSGRATIASEATAFAESIDELPTTVQWRETGKRYCGHLTGEGLAAHGLPALRADPVTRTSLMLLWKRLAC